ncbi:MAG: VWA domain-containing protein [Spirochaetes bacterium]|nr:VWA domain-containing protein [Spirochaetota bacterium]
MKTGKLLIVSAALMALLSSRAGARAESVRISQIDPSMLLFRQDVKVYVSVTGRDGAPVKNIGKEKFSVFESADGTNFTRIPEIGDFRTMANYEEGINFLLLIDNSGSMYLDMKQRLTRDRSAMKFSHAKAAIVTFLKSMTNPKDRVGLASYNSYYQSFSDPVADRATIEGLLARIPEPVGDEGHTEIYASLSRAVDEFRSVKGRKAILILSDGENRPYYRYAGKPHRDFGTKIYSFEEPVRECQEEGISVFAINFGRGGGRRDVHLKDIALQTGGAVFDAGDGSELVRVYSRIVGQILNEYLITYDATMEPADKKYVKIRYAAGSGPVEAVRFYFSSTVFGLPLKEFGIWLLAPLILAALLLWLLSLIRFEKKKGDATIEVINPGSTRAVTRAFKLNKGQTIIGASKGADMTIMSGVTRIREKHATITFDGRKKKYTIAGDGDFKVNNKRVKTRVLESGDVINVGGATIVFDDGEVD